MSQTFDLTLQNATCVVYRPPTGLSAESLDIGILDGKIAALGNLNSKDAKSLVDFSGYHILPGLIDTQVHFREPGLEHKETLASGTRSAIQGGITGVFEMPNTTPPTDSATALKDKISRAERSAWCNYAFYAGATARNIQDLGNLEKLPGCCGIKVFMGSSTGSLLVEGIAHLEELLAKGKKRVAVHCEDEKRLRERRHLAELQPGHVEIHPVWRDEKTAIIATNNLIASARKSGRPIHVLHITTKQELKLLAKNKDIATVECTPQHLTLSSPECYQEIGTLAQMNPPIRGKEHQEALWQAVNEGIVDIMGSDHAPHTTSEKQGTYPNTPSGMPGVQTTVPIMLNHVNEGRLSLVRFVELMAETPSQVFGIKSKGRIALGYDADFTVVDMNSRKVITNQWIESLCGWTPFHGKKVQGWPVATILSGQIVMRDGEVLGTPSGKAFQFD